jgi:hypothetical protein
MDKFAEIHESPATAPVGDAFSHAAAQMSNPASQVAFKDMAAAAGNTASNFLPDMPIDFGKVSVAEWAMAWGGRDISNVLDCFKRDYRPEQIGHARKYDGGSFGIGLEDGSFEQ